jgi:nicotinamide riboside transporter PnuC
MSQMMSNGIPLPAGARSKLTCGLVLAFIAFRLFLTRDPLDWLVLIAGLWGAVSLWGETRKVVSTFVLLLFFVYLKAQVLHMLVVYDVIP